MARPENPKLAAIDDALASGSYFYEIAERYIRRSRAHMTVSDVEDLMAFVETWERTKEYIVQAREVISGEYQNGREDAMRGKKGS